MNRWPKEWINEIEIILARLNEVLRTYNSALGCRGYHDKVGALKDPPQPREIWYCTGCNAIVSTSSTMKVEASNTEKQHEVIKMREVTDE